MKRKANPVAKTTRPVFTGTFPRKRLLTLLDLHRSRPVIWISGPLCSGKTILASSYIEERNLSCLWYQIDSRDDDPATFFYYLGLAAKHHIPDSKSPPPLFTPEYRAGLSVFTRRFFKDLFCQLPLPFCFVFDNYQETWDRSLLHEVIREGIRGIPEGISFIIISRTGLPPAFSSLRGDHSIAILGGDELALTLKEVKEMAGLRVREKYRMRSSGRSIRRPVDGQQVLPLCWKGLGDIKTLHKLRMLAWNPVLSALLLRSWKKRMPLQKISC